jgi:hypothetical protein
MAKRPLANEVQYQWFFQHDNAKVRVYIKKVKRWLAIQCGFQVVEWHAESSTLTWIEDV